MPSNDLYSVLGVLPDAEDIVVTAAYRALAQRYHSDKWQGDPKISHERMSEINDAYAILGNKARRSEYDKSRSRGEHANYSDDTGQDQDDAFKDALSGTEGRWQVACSIYPDLVAQRAKLAKTSASLAFSFVIVLLTSKNYNDRASLAEGMEQKFLERYFGSNPDILDYARFLISHGNKAAAKRLNNLVDVMGSNVDPKLIINRIDSDFGIGASKKKMAEEEQRNAAIQGLIPHVRKRGNYDEALSLAQLLGYVVEEIDKGIFKGKTLIVSRSDNTKFNFQNAVDFVYWVQKNLCAES